MNNGNKAWKTLKLWTLRRIGIRIEHKKKAAIPQEILLAKCRL